MSGARNIRCESDPTDLCNACPLQRDDRDSRIVSDHTMRMIDRFGLQTIAGAVVKRRAQRDSHDLAVMQGLVGPELQQLDDGYTAEIEALSTIIACNGINLRR